jgi:hypothetical protein
VTKPGKHVVPSGTGSWAVRNTGAARASRIFETQGQAVQYAQRAAQKDGTVLYVHRLDGAIQAKYSYGTEPAPTAASR